MRELSCGSMYVPALSAGRKINCSSVSRILSIMIIHPAKKSDFNAVVGFYHSLIDALGDNVHFLRWEKDVHPSREELAEAISGSELYIGEADGRIAACMVVNHHGDGYDQVKWMEDLPKERCYVIHLLAVHPDYSGRGYAKKMVRFAFGLAKENHIRSIRLDVLKGNKPADHLYISLGFRQVDRIRLYYSCTGWADFNLYEYLIGIDNDG